MTQTLPEIDFSLLVPTRNRPDKIAVVTPWGDTKGGGISLAMRF